MRTRTQIRQLVAQQIDPGLFEAGTADSGGSTTTLVDANLTRFHDNQLIGAWVYLSSGASFTDLLITDSTQSSGTVTFQPALSAAPDTLNYEVLPFSATVIHRAIDEALLELYDRGVLVRRFWVHHWLTGSPIYNAAFDYWSDDNTLDGWLQTGTVTRLQAIADPDIVVPGNVAARLGIGASITLNLPYRAFLSDLAGASVVLRALIRATGADFRASIEANGSSVGSTPDATGNGQWELVEKTLTIGRSAMNIAVKVSGSVQGDVGAVWVSGGPLFYEYPFPVDLAPDGPDEVFIQPVMVNPTDKTVRTGGPHRPVEYDFYVYREPASPTESKQIGVIRLKQAVPDGYRLWIPVTGPLRLPTADTDVVEVGHHDSLIIAKIAAALILEREMADLTEPDRARIRELAGVLRTQAEGLIRNGRGSGTERAIALYPRW